MPFPARGARGAVSWDAKLCYGGSISTETTHTPIVPQGSGDRLAAPVPGRHPYSKRPFRLFVLYFFYLVFLINFYQNYTIGTSIVFLHILIGTSWDEDIICFLSDVYAGTILHRLN